MVLAVVNLSDYLLVMSFAYTTTNLCTKFEWNLLRDAICIVHIFKMIPHIALNELQNCVPSVKFGANIFALAGLGAVVRTAKISCFYFLRTFLIRVLCLWLMHAYSNNRWFCTRMYVNNIKRLKLWAKTLVYCTLESIVIAEGMT